MKKYIEQTIEYYNNNSLLYRDNWNNFEYDVPNIFLSYLNAGDYILDLGCGSGRDSKIFLDKGYRVKAIDGSQEMCKVAKEYLGIEVSELNFLDMNFSNVFDGVFANASLLHLKKPDLIIVLKKISLALKQDGIFFCSFKNGCGERIKDDGRFFYDMTDEKFTEIIKLYNDFEILKMWATKNEGHIGFNNYLLKKIKQNNIY